jgi:hypothetical protein
MRRARRAARDDGGTSLVTRFGERGDVADAREVVELADRYGEGWFFGAYKAYGDAGARPLYSDRGRPFASRVRTVAVPYPQRIAGREATWAFDRPDRRFTLRYRPRGGAETVVALPRAAFPDVARVSASGARTRRDGGMVLLRARGGADGAPNGERSVVVALDHPPDQRGLSCGQPRAARAVAASAGDGA